MTNAMDDCLKHTLQKILLPKAVVAVAFSGGTDSSCLLACIKYSRMAEVVAVTGDSPFQSRREIDRAKKIASFLEVEHILLPFDPLGIPELVENSRQRCYLCKHHLFLQMKKHLKSHGITMLLHGENYDDLREERPGSKAAEEAGVPAPLRMAKAGKKEVRELSRKMGLPNWNAPAQSCLATRFPTGQILTKEALEQVEKSEDFILEQGFETCRVRVHNDIARIELSGKDIPGFMEQNIWAQVNQRLKQLGFSHVCLDLGGYRMGSMDLSVR